MEQQLPMELYLQVIIILALQKTGITTFSGNDVIGNFGSIGNFDVNTNKFAVVDHGNTAVIKFLDNCITFN